MNKTLFLSVLAVLSLQSVCNAVDAESPIVSAYKDGDTSDDDGAASDALPEPTMAGPGTSPAATGVDLESNRLRTRDRLFNEGDFLNKLRSYRFTTPSERQEAAGNYNPLITLALDDMATSKKTP